MRNLILPIDENENFFIGYFNEAPFFAIYNEKNLISKFNNKDLHLEDLSNVLLMGIDASKEFKEKLQKNRLSFIFQNFSNLEEVLEFYTLHEKKVNVFNLHTQDYEDWFEKNEFVYKSEIEALKKAIPKGRGIEIGVGSGRFASELGINEGVEPSSEMAKIAQKKGIKVYKGIAENLPIADNSYDFALMAVTICFVNDPLKSLQEANRILKPGGRIIVGIVDLDTPLGKIYLKKKENSVFYEFAKFFSSIEIIDLLTKALFKYKEAHQVLFGDYNDIKFVQEPKPNFGEGGFAVIVGEK